MRQSLQEAWARIAQLGYDTVARLPIILVAIVVFFVFHFIAKLVRSSVYRVSRRYDRGHNAALVFGRLAQAGIITLGVLVALVISVPTFLVGDLVGFLGIGSIAVGFAFRDILQNFLAGILLLLTQPFRVGDQIIVAIYEGTVEEIQTRATMIKTYDGRRVVIPNADLFTNSVTVNTAFPQRRLEQVVGIGYGDDIATARGLMLEAMRQTEGVLAEPEPDVVVIGFGESSVNFRARWWVEPPRLQNALDLQDKVLEAIKVKLNENGIDLPFPTRQVLFHDQTEETDGDRRRQREGWPAGKGEVPRPRASPPRFSRCRRRAHRDCRSTAACDLALRPYDVAPTRIASRRSSVPS